MRLIVVAGQTALTALGNGDKVGTWSLGGMRSCCAPEFRCGAIAVY
ncbi:MAG: hypothetical protein V3T18_10470 [Pseudomonadales bacterium]